MAAGDAYNNAMFGMADPNHGPTAGGKIQKSISDADLGLQKLLSTLNQIDRKLTSIGKKAQSLSGSLGGKSGSGSGSNANGRQNPSFTVNQRAMNSSHVNQGNFIPGLGNNSTIGGGPDANAIVGSGNGSNGLGLGLGRFGTAMAEAGVQAMLQSTGGLYDQDRLYTSMRLSGMVNGRSGQNGLAKTFAKGFAGSYTSQDQLQQAQYMLRDIGFANRNYTPQFASGFVQATKMANTDAVGMASTYATLSQGPTQNLLRAYGIGVRGRDPQQVLGQIYNQVFARAPGGKPTKDQIETSFQVGGNAYQTAINLGIDPAMFKDFAEAKAAGNTKAFDQSVPGTSMNRAGKSNSKMQAGYGARVGATNSVNGAVGEIATLLPDVVTNLKAVGDGLATLGGVPGGNRNVMGTALNSVIEGMIFKTLMGTGKGAPTGPGLVGRMTGGNGLKGFLGSTGFKAGAGALGLGVLGDQLQKHGHSTTGKLASAGSMALTGAALGSLVGPEGTLVGGVLGGALGAWQAFTGGPDSKKAGTDGSGNGQTFGQLEQLAKGLGGGYAITSTTGGKHATNSLHYKGDAIDIGSLPNPGDPAGLLRINKYFASRYGSHLSELIYGGPGGINIKNGRVLSRAEAVNVYGADILAQHRNHVHVAATPDMLSGAGKGAASDTFDGSGTTGGGDLGAGGIGSAVLAMAQAAQAKYDAVPWVTVGNGQGGGTKSGAKVSAASVGKAPSNPSGNAALGKKMAAAMGWTGKQWDALYALWQQESGWNDKASNGVAYGIPQGYLSAHPDYVKIMHNGPQAQIQWGLDYIRGRYGSPLGAMQNKHNTDSNLGSHAQDAQPGGWYSKGAWRIANDKKANVHEGEMILPARIADAVRGEMSRGMTAKPQGGGNKVDIHLTIRDASDAEAQRLAMKVKRILEEDEYVHTIAGH